MKAQPGSGADQLQPVTGIDAAFLHTETSSTHWHVLGVALLDPSTASEPFDAHVMRRVLADRIDKVEVFRRRVVDQAVGMSQPHWLPTDVDLDVHVTSVVLPDGSGMAELAALVGEMGSTPLSRDRPMWEFAIVEGLANGRRAMLAKIHHSLVDGVAAVGVMGAIFDTEPVAAPPLPEGRGIPAPEVPRRDYLTAAARTVKNQPAMVARSVTRLAGTSWRVAQRIARREPSGTLPLTAPRTCLSSSITARRATAFATVDIDAVKEIRRAFGVTFNDVVMAIAAGALREWLRDNGDLPDRPLVAAIPMSVRGEASDLPGNNVVSTLFGALPTHLADPAARVRFVAQEMPGAKSLHEELGATTLGSLATVAPWNLASALFRAYSNLGLANRLPPIVNLILTSVPGPPVPLYCGGARLESLFPLGPIFDGAALNITALSYTDHVCFGFIACPDVCPPVEHLADAIPTVLNELVAAARAAELGQELAMDIQERNRAALDAVQERRDEFYEGILDLERAMAMPAGDDPVAWGQHVTVAVKSMHTVLDDHIAETEAPGSFYDDVIEHVPNLIKASQRLQAEHPVLVRELDQLDVEIKGVTDDESVEHARQTALDMIKTLLLHRHRGAELVYDAYNIDVATGD